MKNLTKLKIISFLWGAAFHMPIISLYFLNNGVSLQAIVISQTIYSIFAFIGEVPTGLIADKFGQKTSIFLGYVLEAFGLSVMLFMPNVAGLYLVYSLIGIAESFLSGSQEALVYESYHHESPAGTYQKHYGGFLSNQIASFAITTFIAGFVINYFDKQAYPFLIIASTISLILAALLSLTLKRIHETTKLTAQPGAFDILRKSFLLIKSHKTIFSLMVVTVLTLSGEYFLYGVYQPYFEQAHVPNLYLGLVLSLGSVLNYLLLRYTYVFERFLPFEKIVPVLNLPLAIGYILMAIFINPIFLVLSFIFMKGLFEVQSPIISDYVNEYTESSIRSTVLSGISLIKSFANIILRLLLAGIVGAWGISSAFLVLGFYLLIGVLIGYWILVRCGCTYKINRTITPI